MIGIVIAIIMGIVGLLVFLVIAFLGLGGLGDGSAKAGYTSAKGEDGTFHRKVDSPTKPNCYNVIWTPVNHLKKVVDYNIPKESLVYVPPMGEYSNPRGKWVALADRDGESPFFKHIGMHNINLGKVISDLRTDKEIAEGVAKTKVKLMGLEKKDRIEEGLDIIGKIKRETGNPYFNPFNRGRGD